MIAKTLPIGMSSYIKLSFQLRYHIDLVAIILGHRCYWGRPIRVKLMKTCKNS